MSFWFWYLPFPLSTSSWTNYPGHTHIPKPLNTWRNFVRPSSYTLPCESLVILRRIYSTYSACKIPACGSTIYVTIWQGFDWYLPGWVKLNVSLFSLCGWIHAFCIQRIVILSLRLLFRWTIRNRVVLGCGCYFGWLN